MNIRQGLLLPLAIAASLTLVACSANEINSGIGIAGHLFKGFSVTNEQLIAESRLSATAMDRKNKVAPPENKYTRRLRKLSRNLRHYDGLTLNYKVYLIDKVNAFAMPDGTIRVYSGLMDMMNDDELISVLGHEIGHVKHQHSLSQYRKAYIAKAAQQGLVAYGGNTASALAGSYGEIGLAAMNARFSQSDELEADIYSVGVLHKLGRNPYAAADAHRKLKALGGSRGGLMSTHPPSDSRIRATTEAAEKIAKK